MTVLQKYALCRLGALGKALFFGAICISGVFWKLALRALCCLRAASGLFLTHFWHAIRWLARHVLAILISLIYLLPYLLLVVAVIAVALFLAYVMIVVAS